MTCDEYNRYIEAVDALVRTCEIDSKRAQRLIERAKKELEEEEKACN